MSKTIETDKFDN